MKYIVTGLNMIDILEDPDGRRSEPQMGGIPIYGFCGMRLFTDSIQFAARVGRDFYSIFDPWFSENKIDSRGLQFVSEKTPYNVLKYAKDNTIKSWDFFTGDWKDSDFWRPKTEDIEKIITKDVKGVYLSAGPREEIWDGIFSLQEKYGFKIMWEPNGIHTQPEDKEEIIKLSKKINMTSFNLTEGKRIFGISTESELIDFLQNSGRELILLRVGARGLYTITKDEVVFVPSVELPGDAKVIDVTGCGNSSTSAACYGWCEGYDPAMTGIIANVASSYNLRQKGPYPVFTEDIMKEAFALAKDLYHKKAYKKLKGAI